MPAEPVGADGRFEPPALDVEGYLVCVERCRDLFPGLRILSGVELGEPHWFAGKSSALLASGDFDRVLGSLHPLYEVTAGGRIFYFVDDPTGGGRTKPQRRGRGPKPRRRVIIEAVHPGHPKGTEHKRG